MGFYRQEYWSGLPFPFSGDLPDPGIESRSPALQADSLPSESPGKLLQRMKRQTTNREDICKSKNLITHLIKDFHIKYLKNT